MGKLDLPIELGHDALLEAVQSVGDMWIIRFAARHVAPAAVA